MMRREYFSRAIPVLIIALVILTRSLGERGYDYWGYACYAVIVALAVYTIASPSAIPETRPPATSNS